MHMITGTRAPLREKCSVPDLAIKGQFSERCLIFELVPHVLAVLFGDRTRSVDEVFATDLWALLEV